MTPKPKKHKSFRQEIQDFEKLDPELYEYLRKEEPDVFRESLDIEQEIEADESLGIDEQEESYVCEDISYEQRKDVDCVLVEKIRTVLSNPTTHQKLLPRTVKKALKMFLFCIRKFGIESALEESDEFFVDEDDFDEIIQLCLIHLARCIMILISPIGSETDIADIEHRCNKLGPRAKQCFKRWKYSLLAKTYLSALNSLLTETRDDLIMQHAVNQIKELALIITHISKATKVITRTLVRLWSSKSLEIRKTSFIALKELIRFRPKIYSSIYKDCYKAYISNCKSVEERTLPFIRFMQTSFTKLVLLDAEASYEYTFAYIRQFSIHLRNAIIAKRKELIQNIYNWQFLKGLEIWVAVLCKLCKHFGETNGCSQLIYPLTEVISTARRLFCSPKYLPFRIHCIKMLLKLQKNLGVFIPTFAYSIELLDDFAEIMKIPQSSRHTDKQPRIECLYRLTSMTFADTNHQLLMANELCVLCKNAAALYPSHSQNAILLSIVKLKKFVNICRRPEIRNIFKPLCQNLLNGS